MHIKFRGILLFLFTMIFDFSFAQVQISEIAWMGTSNSSYDEWIELYNTGEEPVNLENWRLLSEDGSPNIILIGEIPAKSYFLLERTDDTSVPNFLADQIYTGSLSNSGEKLILKNELGVEIDRTPSGEWVSGENSAKKTMERRDFTIPGSIESAWQTFQGESLEESFILGTPKQNNSGNILLPVPQNLEFVSRYDEVEITKIHPISDNSGGIWLEFSVKSDYSAVDITNWQISNGEKSLSISELLEDLVVISGSDNLAGNSVYLDDQGLLKKNEQNMPPNFMLEEERLIFHPISEDKNMIFGIRNNLLTIPESREFYIKESFNNIAKRVFAKDLQIIISEISPNNKEHDFFELFVKEAEGIVDLKNMEIRHNGKTLFFAENSILVKKGDILTFYLQAEKTQESPKKYTNKTVLQETGDSFIWEKSAKNGIVASSGTMEIILWSETDWEQSSDQNGETEDFVCWSQKNLNKTETKRFKKNIPQNWYQECIKVDKIHKNESIARSEPQTDGNNSRDFYRHFHGSPGEPNFIKNHKPKAKIKLQSGEFSGNSRVNLTALERDNSASTDGDGLDDIRSFQWEINGKTCGKYAEDGWNWKNKNCYLESQKSNPSYLYFDFEKHENFEVSLLIMDLAGYVDRTKITISREILTEEKTEESSELDYSKNEEMDNFFSDFLKNTDLDKLKEIAYASNQPSQIEKNTNRYLFARDKFSAKQKSSMAKNIGLIFQ